MSQVYDWAKEGGILDEAPAYNETPGFIDQVSEWVNNSDNSNDMRLNQVVDENYTEQLDHQVVSKISSALNEGKYIPHTDIAFLIKQMSSKRQKEVLTTIKSIDKDTFIAIANILWPVVATESQSHSSDIKEAYNETEAAGGVIASGPALSIPGLSWDANKMGSIINHNDERFTLVSGPSPIIVRRESDGKDLPVR